MAVINVSAGQEAVLELAPVGQIGANANVLTVPYLQDITITNSTGVFRWQTLDSTSESAAATPATNQISLNLVVDDDAFFGNASLSANGTVVETGIFGISNAKTEVSFRAYFNGTDSGSKYVQGTGFISGLAPTVNPGAPVWVTPVTIEVNGDYTEGEVT